MNQKQIAFIICTNNMQYYSECVRYIEDLEVPEGYSTDIICIQEAESMTQGYNAGMQASDAKYKVYLHQDTFILNTHFLFDILHIFEQDERIGMLGVLGGETLPTDANCYLQWDVGAILVYNTKGVIKCVNRQERIKGYMPVMAVDGLIMVTQVDIPWREDFLEGWDFYDVSQSLEMRKEGYQVVVPYQEEPWCYHDCGLSKLENYDYYRHKVIEEYPRYFREGGDLEEELKEKKYREEIKGIREGMHKIANAGAYDELCRFTNDIREFNLADTWIQEMTNLMDIYSLEKANGKGKISEWWALKDWEQLYEYYRWLRFVLLRTGYQREDERIEELKTMIGEGRLTKDAVRQTGHLILTFPEEEKIYDTFLKEDYAEPFVSVVIPVYNGAEFVSETIESVLNQTYQNMEIIIIDDASTDNSREVINSYHDTRIKTIFLEKNNNICYTGNLGFQAAGGKYVAVIGHDDVWASTKLEKQVTFMEEHPAYSVCFTWVDIIDENGKLMNEEESILYHAFCTENKPANRWIRELFMGNNSFCAPSSCIRKECLDKAGYYKYGLVQLQDYELWMRLLCQGPAFVLPEKLTFYRRFRKEGQNLSSRNRAVLNRSIHEKQYFSDAYLDSISDEQFIWIFGKDMKNADSRSENEIRCEKAFLLFGNNNCYSIKRFMELLDEEETRKLLAEKYHFELQDFYKMNTREIYFNVIN